ncbi:hypothetical protein A5753_12800 [Mycobacterium sp. 852002-51971_SCH5477799-a]|uniref:hypothetical protein n=1 Tax=Mycobacterium sp. 852002-51971_SCH5477799-a TaxID=1834106 RepID=UPI0007FC2B23|nr:hypothetical protein [Mycobacterium sp. 852002-51971_SCH5477799-a]OBF63381.1 hypothetical protein A5753_12800 [Mycobacterium sp. 852002-51971_SCH5477799-a]
MWDLITTVAGITERYEAWDAVEHAAVSNGFSGHEVPAGPSPHRRRQNRAVPRDLGRGTATLVLAAAPHLPTMSVEFDLVPVTGTSQLNHTRTSVASPLS